MSLITTLLIGFSVIAAIIMALAYTFFLEQMSKTAVGKFACVALLATLSLLQLAHLDYLHSETDLLSTRYYAFLLMMAPTTFFFFSREILQPDAGLGPLQAANLLPLPAALLLPVDIAAPLAFVVGAAYTLWFLRLVFGMRRHVSRFRFELFFFGLFAALALVTLAFVFLIPATGDATFYTAYAVCIGVGLALTVAALMVFPELLADIAETARLSYANTTLGGVDVPDRLAALERLMREDKLYANDSLNLAATAEALTLSPHQLSELINTQFGHGFSRYVREQRVTEARRLLAEDDRSSVLSIGMSVGFRSQSNFYAAFREITGETPGGYRKRVRGS